MITIGTYEAKTKFTALLKRVSRGEKVTISKHGVPVATLQAFASAPTRPVEDVIEEIKKMRAGHSLKGASLRSMIDEGRR